MSQTFTVAHQGFDIPLELHITDGNNRRPGLLLIHDQWGPDDFTRAAAARLAESGYVVALPDLMMRFGAPADDSPVARDDFLFNLSDTQITGDALATLRFLARHENVDPKYLGVIGWGWGGAFALMTAGHDSRLRAVADIGGNITFPMLSANHSGSPLNFVADIEGAVFAAYPAEGAQPSGEIERLREKLNEHDKLSEVKVFSGTKGRFWREDTPQAALLWRRIEQFFAEVFTLDTQTLLYADGGEDN